MSASRPSVLIVGPGANSAGGVWSVISTMMASDLANRYALQNIATHRDGSRWAKLGQAVVGIGQVAVRLAVKRPDLVWIHTSSNASARRKTVVMSLARLLRVPRVLHVHGSEFEVAYRAAKPAEQAMVRLLLRSADLIIALTPTWEARLQAMTPCVTTTVMNPVDIPDAADADGRVPGRIVSLGRVGERKGSAVIVAALAELVERHPEAHVILAGDGDHAPVQAAAQALGVADRLEMRSWISPAEVGELLDSAAIFTLPSREEGLPVAMLEAMAHGLPSVVTPVGGIPDFVHDGVNGIMVSPDDPAGLAAALATLLADPDAAARLGAAARVEVTERCATPNVVNLIDAAFCSVLGRRADRPART